MQGTSDDQDLAAFVASFDARQGLITERLVKESPTERTELVKDTGGRCMIRKHLVLDNQTMHAYELLERQPCEYLPQVLQTQRVGDNLMVLMELLEGDTLEQRVNERGPLSLHDILSVLRGVFLGLSWLHQGMEQPVIHRDVKPQNIVVTADGGKLIDLGIARQWRADAQQDTTILGTAGYAAPEQFGFRQSDARSDIYALGKTVRYALTGAQPDEESGAAVPLQVQQVIDRACAFEPDARWGSVIEFWNALDAAVHDVLRDYNGAAPQAPWEDEAAAQTAHNPQQAAVATASAQATSQATAAPKAYRPLAKHRFLRGNILAWGMLCVIAGFELTFSPGQEHSPVLYAGMSLFVFLIPMLVLSDPFCLLSRFGFYGAQPKKRIGQTIGISFALMFAMLFVMDALVGRI